MDPSTCPDRALLSEFAVGNLSRASLARVAGHIERCAACETALRALDDRADSLLARLRQAAGSEPATVDPVPPGLLDAARAARREGELAAPGAGGPPRQLGQFELLEELGLGSFGHVFRARDTELDRVVAIK